MKKMLARLIMFIENIPLPDIIRRLPNGTECRRVMEQNNVLLQVNKVINPRYYTTYEVSLVASSNVK